MLSERIIYHENSRQSIKAPVSVTDGAEHFAIVENGFEGLKVD